MGEKDATGTFPGDTVAGPDIWFFATSKSGLGHLRRAATIARAIQARAPGRAVHLVSNAPPEGLNPEDLQAFSAVHVRDRDAMAGLVAGTGRVTMVLDTIKVPGIEQADGRLTLVLRETPPAELGRFQLAGGRHWDQVIVANPADHWLPAHTALSGADLRPVGWIYRPTGPRNGAGPNVPTVLVATGGGGIADTARSLYAEIDRILGQVRRRSARPFRVVQAIGPRATGFGTLAQADSVLDPGGRLNQAFREADITLSTAGYNSVLELATTDTPTMLVPIPRSIDDQAARARLWGPRLGTWHDEAAPQASVDWLLLQIATPARRAPADLGASGEGLAAEAILQP